MDNIWEKDKSNNGLEIQIQVLVILLLLYVLQNKFCKTV